MSDEPKRYVKLILVRHTQSTMNVAGRYTGSRAEAVLTPFGVRQADSLATDLSAQPIRAIYSSDLLRCRQVAFFLSTRCGLDATYDPRLREVDVGLMTGLTKKEAQERYPELQFRTRDPSFDFRPLGGESRRQVINRQLACFNEILERHGRQSPTEAELVVVIGHGSSLATMLIHLGIDPPKIHPQGCSQTIVYSA